MGADVELFNLPVAIRTNTLKISSTELKKRLEARKVKVKKIPFAREGFYVESRFSIGATPEYLQGYYYVQEAASQLPVEVLDPTGVVLDCCAAPGGKTSQLAMYSDLVLAFEKSHKRLQALKNNLERLSISNCILYNYDVRKIEGVFDHILVDAPCSGNMFIDKKWLRKQTLSNIKSRSKIQKEILGNMIKCLAPGGELVYSTCSLEPEENEMVVDWALKSFDVKLLDIDCIGSPGLTKFQGKKFNKSLKKCRRLWPNKTKTQGFFIAKIQND